jgi:hypothetical protein
MEQQEALPMEKTAVIRKVAMDVLVHLVLTVVASVAPSHQGVVDRSHVEEVVEEVRRTEVEVVQLED